MKIKAYIVHHKTCELIVPDKKRQWMDESYNGFAYRCLPLTVANGFGWTALCPEKFTAVWSGTNEINSVKIYCESDNFFVLSHFGQGILTFHLGYMFRTEPGVNLYVKGPANNPKRGVVALEGMVETDWLPFTFTMNWKITEPNVPIVFEKNEPICTFFPYPRHYIESFDPAIQPIQSDPETHALYKEWANSRTHYNANLKTNGNKGERDYLRGIGKDGTKYEDHQNNIKAKDFTKCIDNCCNE